MTTLTIISYIKSNGDRFLITNRTTSLARGVVVIALLSNFAMAQLRADDLSPAGTNGVARTTQTVANQGSQANVVSTAGLVGYWPFDETSGTTAYDSSGNASNGSLSCSGSCASLPNWVAGKRNGALNFSLPNDLAAVADVPTLRLSTNFTISFWLKKSAGALNVSYISKGANSNGYQVATGNSGNSIYLNIVRNNAVVAQCAANGVILDQTWEHIAVTYNGAIIHFYINGAPSASCSATAAAGSDLSHLLFGGTNTSKPTGTMDEVRIYNRALSAQEIIAVYNDGGVTAPVSVSVAPANAVLSAGQTQQFSLTGTVTSGISWAISPLTGSVSSTGLYTAPGSVSSAQSVTVTARNASTNAVVGTAAVSLQPVSTLGTFQLSELFGVSWPDKRSNSAMTGANRQEPRECCSRTGLLYRRYPSNGCLPAPMLRRRKDALRFAALCQPTPPIRGHCKAARRRLLLSILFNWQPWVRIMKSPMA